MRSAAYRDGWQAYRDGEAQQENPYIPQHENWYQWDYGWRDAAYAGYQSIHEIDPDEAG